MLAAAGQNTTSSEEVDQNSPDVKGVELPDCDLAAKHFVSSGFWEQKKSNAKRPSAVTDQQFCHEGSPR